MTATDLLEVLLAEIADNNEAFVDQLLESARAKILAGGGEISPLFRAQLNGKEFWKAVRLDAAQVARICRQAKAEAAGDAVVSTRLDFSGLSF